MIKFFESGETKFDQVDSLKKLIDKYYNALFTDGFDSVANVVNDVQIVENLKSKYSQVSDLNRTRKVYWQFIMRTMPILKNLIKKNKIKGVN